MKTKDLVKAVADVLGLDVSELTAAHAAFVSDLKEEAER